MAPRDQQDLIGLCGLVLDPPATQGEAWYLLAPGYWGQGYGTVRVSRFTWWRAVPTGS
jgi:RimJ/RimL family protein N-acetyltransferase